MFNTLVECVNLILIELLQFSPDFVSDKKLYYTCDYKVHVGHLKAWYLPKYRTLNLSLTGLRSCEKPVGSNWVKNEKAQLGWSYSALINIDADQYGPRTMMIRSILTELSHCKAYNKC